MSNVSPINKIVGASVRGSDEPSGDVVSGESDLESIQKLKQIVAQDKEI